MKRIHPIEKWCRALPGALALAALLTWSPAARADVPPTCDSESSLITCAEADVGKPCQGSGACYQVYCAGRGTIPVDSVYKCDTCPTVLPDQSFGCQPSKFGMDCGGGGTCIYAPSYCGNSTKYICGIAAAVKPTGPPSGTGAGGAGGAPAAGGAGGIPSAPGGAGGASSAAGGAGGSSSGVGGASSAPTTVGSSGGGCDVNNGAPAAGVVAIALIAVGLLFLMLGRRRRSL